MNLAPENERYIVMQRSDFLGRNDVIVRHIADIEREVETLRPFFPENMACFVDIGCGIGAMAVEIALKTGAKAFVIDGNGEIDLRGKKNGAGFHKSYVFYSDKDLIGRNFAENSLEVELLETDATPNVDLVISTLSCGFHYPISTYQSLLDNLKPGARAIFDVRVGLNENPGRGFRKVGLVEHFHRFEGRKHKADRTCWERI
ncbi:MAG: hypothetical protein AAF942_00110 [Pseudomonadota bacterium]